MRLHVKLATEHQGRIRKPALMLAVGRLLHWPDGTVVRPGRRLQSEDVDWSSDFPNPASIRRLQHVVSYLIEPV